MSAIDRSVAWAWVLSRAPQIRTISNRIAKKWSGIDFDDFHQAVLVRVVERFDSIDMGKNEVEISSWLKWQARGVLTTHRKAALRQKRESESIHISSWDPRSNDDGARAVEARVTVRQIHKIADPKEWAAAVAKADGLKGEELSVALGCAPFSASRRVRRLANRIA